MSISLNTFTLVQLDTFQRVKSLEQELKDNMNPGEFVLNKSIMAIQAKIDQLQAECDHIWDEGCCAVCGKIKESE